MTTNTIKSNRRFRHGRGAVIFGLGLISALAGPAWGQGEATDKPAEQKPTAVTHPDNPMVWDVDAMMEQAVQQISKRYRLNPQQEQYTRLFLTRRVREFLDEHETDVRELLQESMDMRMGRAKADRVALQIWSTRAMPLYAEATKAILDGNEEWGEILNEEQKQIHDGDMRLMRTSFTNVTNTLELWKEGKGPPLPVMNKGNQPKSTGNGDEKAGEVGQPVNRTIDNIEDNWLSYVNMFVQAYKLEGGAQVSARDKIYKEQRDKAKRYREQRAADFEQIEKQLAATAKTDASERAKLARRRRQLETRIHQLFIQMDERLKRLPTAAQAANVDPEMKKKLNSLYVALAGGDNAEKSVRQRRTTAKRPIKKDDAKPGESEKNGKAAEKSPTTEPAAKAGPSDPAVKPKEKPADKPEPKTDEDKPKDAPKSERAAA